MSVSSQAKTTPESGKKAQAVKTEATDSSSAPSPTKKAAAPVEDSSFQGPAILVKCPKLYGTTLSDEYGPGVSVANWARSKNTYRCCKCEDLGHSRVPQPRVKEVKQDESSAGPLQRIAVKRWRARRGPYSLGKARTRKYFRPQS